MLHNWGEAKLHVCIQILTFLRHDLSCPYFTIEVKPNSMYVSKYLPFLDMTFPAHASQLRWSQTPCTYPNTYLSWAWPFLPMLHNWGEAKLHVCIQILTFLGHDLSCPYFTIEVKPNSMYVSKYLPFLDMTFPAHASQLRWSQTPCTYPNTYLPWTWPFLPMLHNWGEAKLHVCIQILTFLGHDLSCPYFTIEVKPNSMYVSKYLPFLDMTFPAHASQLRWSQTPYTYPNTYLS